MLDVLDAFVAELRASGLPISVRESIDAAEAITALSLDDRAVLKSALGATLVKTQEHLAVFSSAFDIYFSLKLAGDLPGVFGERDDGDEGAERVNRSAHERGDDGGGEMLDEDGVRALALDALISGERRALERAGAAAVARFGALDATRPVGVSYYVHRTLRGLGLEELLSQLLANVAQQNSGDDDLGARLIGDDYRANARALREQISTEVARRLVSGRGSAAVAKSLRLRLVEDVDFMHASADELSAMRKTVYPLARVLAARLARRRRHRRRGHLDFKKTMRRSLSTGGVPIEPRFRSPHPLRPEIVLFADVSGSVASFARFTVHLVYAISTQFSKVRVIVFIDGIDEVTEILKRSTSIGDALEQIAQSADVVNGDGHSDYGNALLLFKERYLKAITARTNLIVLGDARNNYHAAHSEVLAELKRKARRVYWLNPEPESYWGSGDSIIATYARFCDAVFECRNLRQLKEFVDELG